VRTPRRRGILGRGNSGRGREATGGDPLDGHSSQLGVRSVASVVLVDSVDIAQSIGRNGYLEGRFESSLSSGPAVDVQVVAGGRCDLIAQRLGGHGSLERIAVPTGLEDWFLVTTGALRLPDTTALLVMSMADAVTESVWRHKATGVLVQPPANRDVSWGNEQNAWIENEFVEVPPEGEILSDALRSIAEHLRPLDAEFAVFNVSTFVPGENVHWFTLGGSETESIRASRVNLVVENVAAELEIGLVDIDRVVAELGAGAAVVSSCRYSPEALGFVSDEATATILELPNISRDFASDVMSLSVPRYDRRTINGTLTRWHVEEHTPITRGERLFDILFHDINTRLNASRRHSEHSLAISVVAGRDGFVDRITTHEGAPVAVGTMVGVIVASPGVEWGGDDPLQRFPVGVGVLAHDEGD